MMPLPTCDFEPAVWSVTKVSNDYLISDGLNRCFVPSNLIRGAGEHSRDEEHG